MCRPPDSVNDLPIISRALCSITSILTSDALFLHHSSSPFDLPSDPYFESSFAFRLNDVSPFNLFLVMGTVVGGFIIPLVVICVTDTIASSMCMFLCGFLVSVSAWVRFTDSAR